MADKILLIAIRTDLDDVSLPIRNLLDSVGKQGGPPAHISVFDPDELDKEELAQIFAPDNPSAFQTI